MTDINNIADIKNIDKNNLYKTLELFPNQIEQAWKEVSKIEFDDKYNNIKNVVISGMGGSALGGRIVDSLLNERVRLPIEISTENKLPAYIGKESLVIVSSYSGNTEETIESLKDALMKNANIFGITTGGKLAEILKNENIPSYIFSPRENISNQPRMGLGYSITATLTILSKMEIINISENEIWQVLETTKKLISDFSWDIPDNNNIAKRIALKLKNKALVLIASGHLYGACHAFKNQINENSKTFSVLFDIPEANHHLMEGLKNPLENKNTLSFLFIESDKYSDFIKKRYPVTKDVIEKNYINTLSYKVSSETKVEQIFEVITLGMFVSYYLAMLYSIDPIPIPWVDYFKERLS